MSESSGNAAQNRLLLTGLGILIIIILGLLVVLAAYPSVFAPAPTPTLSSQEAAALLATIPSTSTITPTPTETRTPRPTFTPTPTLTPSITPSPTLTPIPLGPPTLTPEVASFNNAAYTVQKWSPENADYVIAMMEAYPELLSKSARGAGDQNYYRAFRYATLAEREALLRFPDAPRANAWRLDLAYDLARQGAPGAAQQYAELMAKGLNSDEVMPEQLIHWFRAQEPRMTMEITQLVPPEGYLSARLVQVSGPGSAFILLLETPSGFQVNVLTNNFEFPKAPVYTVFASDLTGDGLDEVVIYPLHPISDTVLTAPEIFSIAKSPPTELLFDPLTAQTDLGTNFKVQWETTANPDGYRDLRVQVTLFPACPVEITRIYHWNGKWFAFDQVGSNIKPNLATLAYCRYVIDTSANAWGIAPTISLMEAVLPLWPPATDENGEAFPPDAQDEWRFRLGVYHALAGDKEKATVYFNQIINAPSVPGSSWVAPAQKFLADFQKPEDIYKACVNAEFCDPHQAIINLVNAMPHDAYPQAMTKLWQASVTLRTSGYFDFDGDGVKESWFTVRNHPGDKLELWALVLARDSIRAVFLGTVDSNLPALTYYQEDQVPPIVLIDGTDPFSLLRLPDNLEPYLTRPTLPSTFPDLFQEGLDAAKDALFSGADPAEVRDHLLSLQRTPGLLCKGTFSCDEYYYTLGLAAELAEDQPAAVDAYLHLWREYSRSPFTTIARLKLKGVHIAPTPTNTPTITATLAPTPSPTVTPLSVTSTVTITPTPATTVGSTPGATPYPVGTPTLPYP